MKITENDAQTRLDVYVSAAASVTRSHAQKMIENAYVTVNGATQDKNYRLRPGDEVGIMPCPPVELNAEPEDIPLNVVYEDEDIIVINKQSGMVVHPAPGNEKGTLVNALLHHCGKSLSGINGIIRPGIVHRIDKDTSGLLVAAKNDGAHLFLSSLLKSHGINRIYHAIVTGHFKENSGVVNAPIARHPNDRKRMAVVAGGREAVTYYETVEEFDRFTYAKMRLETGRTHQIRVHMSYIGHSILGDSVYGGGNTSFEKNNAKLINGQLLHAKELSFPHPRTKEIVSFECPLPDNFLLVLEKLRKT